MVYPSRDKINATHLSLTPKKMKVIIPTKDRTQRGMRTRSNLVVYRPYGSQDQGGGCGQACGSIGQGGGGGAGGGAQVPYPAHPPAEEGREPVARPRDLEKNRKEPHGGGVPMACGGVGIELVGTWARLYSPFPPSPLSLSISKSIQPPSEPRSAN